MSLALAIPGGGALFEGHFPGRPILPGVAQLALVADAVARSATLRAIPFARLHRPVLPGDRLAIATRELGPGHMRVDVKRDGATVTNAALEFGKPTPGLQRSPLRAVPAEIGAELLPHKPPMRLVTAILAEQPEAIVCAVRIPAACGLASTGDAPALAGLEAAAQCAALWEAIQRARDGGKGGARLGYLVSLRDIVFHAARIPAETEFTASVALAAASMPMTWYSVEIAVGHRLVATGTIATYLTEERIV